MHLTPRDFLAFAAFVRKRAYAHLFRPPVAQESAPRTVTAPRAVKPRGGTLKRSPNRLEWLQIALHLEDTRRRA